MTDKVMYFLFERLNSDPQTNKQQDPWVAKVRCNCTGMMKPFKYERPEVSEIPHSEFQKVAPDCLRRPSESHQFSRQDLYDFCNSVKEKEKADKWFNDLKSRFVMPQVTDQSLSPEEQQRQREVVKGGQELLDRYLRKRAGKPIPKRWEWPPQ